MARTAPVPNIPPIPGMCPSIAVLGGGGGGGGGSGDGAGNGDGSGNGTGDGSGEGAGGAGNGAGACGNGAPGSCTNCSSNVAAGDPVDVVTGEVFTTPKMELFLPGPFNLEIRRKYSSFSRKHDVGLGWGWSHSLAWSMHVARDRIVVRSGFGQAVTFPKLEVGESSGMRGWGLFRSTEGYVLRPGVEFFHVFVADERTPETPLLRVIRFRNRGEICLAYERGLLVRALDAAGRTIHFARTSEGKIASISVPDASGNTLVFARYQYDHGGHLIEAVDADGHAYRYAYDDDRRLIAHELPTGTTFHFLYDLQGRCVETWGDRSDGRDPALDPTLPEVLADGSTKARGIHHAKLDFGSEGFTEVVDSVRIQRFFGTPEGAVTKAVNGRGGVTSRTVDERGDILSETDANRATWTYSHDPLGNVASEQDPEGRTVRYQHDNEGRTIEIVDPLGGVITHTRDRHGNVQSSRDQKGAFTHYTHDDRGVLVEESLPDGARWRYTLDAHANTVCVTAPTGAEHRFEFDYWGRCVRETLPDGRTFRCSFSNGGRLLQVTDGMGRIKAFEYDGLGNLTAERLPDGSVTRYLHAGLGWLHTVEQPGGTTIRRYFNREGWVLRVENEKGERTEIDYGPSGVAQSERGFDGREIRYGRDARDRLVWFKDALGKTEIKRNKVGQVLSWAGPDGEETTLDYDGRGSVRASTHGGVKVEWERDETGKIVEERFAVGGATYSVENMRDAMGRRVGMQSSLGHIVEAPRDSLGQVREISANGELCVRFGRDAMGWPVRRDLARGASIIDDLDAAGRVHHRVVTTPNAAADFPDGRPERIGGPLPGAIDKTYEYSPIDELASVTTSADGTVEFEYDLRRHLTAKRGRRGEELFAYDETGNPFELGPTAPMRRYAPGNRLLSRGEIDYVHDDLGRVVEKRRRLSDGAIETTRYEWDSLNLLRAVDLPDGRRVENAHDTFARRVQKRLLRRLPTGKLELLSTTHYVWDLVSLIHEVVRKPDGTSTVRTYLHESHEQVTPIAQRDDEARDWTHYVGDVSGSPEELVDAAGNVVGKASHTAYGAWTWAASSKETTAFRFPGQIADPETGLHDNRYRTYDPETGRYLTQDPIGLDGGYNLYEYGPNPVVWADPMGWQHVMTLASPPPSFTPTHHQGTTGADVVYQSGMQGLDAGHDLRSRARCHTEQRFAADLMAGNPRRDGEHYQLSGQYPPCPNCHRALQNAAAQTGASVTYSWGNGNQITYHGGPAGNASAAPPPTFSDTHQAQRLAGAYATTPDADRRNNYAFDDHGRAQGAYTGIMNQFYR